MPTLPDEDIVTCPGCGGKNRAGSNECDWCGRTFVSKGGRLRLTLWQAISSLLVLALIAAVAALAYLNAGRALPPVRVSAAASTTPAATLIPTLAVTPRVTTATPATATPLPVASGSASALETPIPRTPEPTATPVVQLARIVNTNGQGVSVRNQPGPQATRSGVLREGTRVVLTGNDQTVAARPWKEIETEDRSLKGWVQSDFLQAQASP